jgi:threonine/homoserine efflux transporter RhtA
MATRLILIAVGVIVCSPILLFYLAPALIPMGTFSALTVAASILLIFASVKAYRHKQFGILAMTVAIIGVILFAIYRLAL